MVLKLKGSVARVGASKDTSGGYNSKNQDGIIYLNSSRDVRSGCAMAEE